MAKNKVTIQVDVETSKAVSSLDKVDAKLKGVAKSEKKVADGGKEMSQSASGAGGALNTMTGGAIAGFRGMVGGIKKGVMGLRTFKGALAATGIGLLVVAVGALVAYFTKTRKGAEMLEVATAMVGVVFGKITDVISGLGGMLVSLFTNPVEKIKEFGNFLKSFVMDRVTNLMDGLGFLGSAISKLFSGDFSGAMADAKSGVENLALANPLIAGTVLVVKNVAEAAKEMAKEITTAVSAAGKLAQRSIDLREAQRDLNEEFAEGRATIRELQLISEDQTKSIGERIAASEEAGRIEADLLAKKQANMQEELDIHNANMALTESLEEDFKKRSDLIVALTDLRTQSARIQKSILMKTQILRKEEITKQAAEDKALLEAEAKKAKELQLLADAQLTADALQIEKANRKFDALVEIANKYGQDTTELEKRRQEELTKIREKNAAKEVEEITTSNTQKLQLATQAMGALSALNEAFGNDSEESQKKQFKRNKALSMSTAIVNTALAISDALAKDGVAPMSRYISAATAGAMGLAQVVAIKKTQYKSTTPPTTTTVTPGTGGSGGAINTAPQIDFGFLGGGAGQGGVRAYVIGQNITNQQQADQLIMNQTTL